MKLYIFLLFLFLSLSVEAAGPFWVDLSGVGTGLKDGSDVNNLCDSVTDADCNESAGETVYLCNAGTSQLAAANLVSGSDPNYTVYDMSCPSGEQGSITTTGTTTALTFGTKDWIKLVEPVISQTGTGDCIGMTGATNIIVDGEGNCTNCGTENAVWDNDDERGGVIGPCGDNAFQVGNSALDTITFTGLYIKNSTGHSFQFAPDTGTAQDNILIKDSYFEDCGSDGTHHCIQYNASGGGTTSNLVIQNTLFVRAYDIAVKAGGIDNDQHDAQHVSPIWQDLTCVDCGWYAYTDPTITGSNFQPHDHINGIFRRITAIRAASEGGVFTSFSGRASIVEDITCIDNVFLEGQDNSSFCVDFDIDNIGAVARRLFDINNRGLHSISGCSGGSSCSGTSFATFDSQDIKFQSAVSINARTCIYVSDPASFTVTDTDDVVFENITCVNPINYGAVVQLNVDDNAVIIRNSIFYGAGTVGLDVRGSVVIGHNNNLYFNNLDNGVTPGATDLTADPLFKQATNQRTIDDVQLRSTSPARRSGVCTLTGGCIANDINNKRSRVPPDIGAHQRQ